MPQFSYCPLILMFYSRAMEYMINRTYDRTLKPIYPNQHELTFKELLEENQTAGIHQRNIQTLVNEIYKDKKVSPEAVNSFEFTNKNCNHRNASILKM